MKLLSASLLVLSLSLGSFGARLVERSKFSAKEKCPSAVQVASTTINANGIEIVRQSFYCPDGSLVKAGVPVGNGKTFASSALERRNAAECKTPAPECQCGTAFSCECQNVTAKAPASGDCNTLVNSLSVVSQAAGPTFIVQPDSFELVSFNTCALEFTSFSNTPLEYCWDELANTGGLVNQVCFEQANGGTAAACNSNNGLWLSQAIRPSN
ncbi:uncharacterized protein FOMMEDRAFT_148236 [Fomitiporia mediterranea MF3/22]|uniref:uncharacterized protein n=1 Tax=Fomitiporia mediterranea (strain MF3/22) TaxID=694068 RepID=UPI00044078B7|nr:uncharacterized protein FOMMEDRAFT_148236 [Fomitiporia mediterranea MF3/22]EJD00462.1 hypothetical protein FOMMEDRAFT_148236 [Fomitiporia mediterranea MF3/22]